MQKQHSNPHDLITESPGCCFWYSQAFGGFLVSKRTIRLFSCVKVELGGGKELSEMLSFAFQFTV